MNPQGEKTKSKKAKKRIDWVFAKHVLIVIVATWLIVSQILAVISIRFLVQNYRFVPKAEVQKVEAVLSPLSNK